MSLEEEMRAILGEARGFWEARILMTAAELDVFSLLQHAPKTAQQVCEDLSSDRRGTEALLNALVALGLLVKEGGAFRTRPGFENALSRLAPETVLPMILHMAQLWSSWGKLTEIVLGGKEAQPAEALERDLEGVRAFIGAMHTIGRGMAQGRGTLRHQYAGQYPGRQHLFVR